MNDTNKRDLLTLLLQTEKKLSELESLSQIGTWEYDLSTKKLDWSDEMFRIFFQDIHGLIHFADRFQWELMINKATMDGHPNHVEIRILNYDGSITWIRKSVKGVFEDKGLTAIRGFCQDITEMKKLSQHFEMTKNLVK